MVDASHVVKITVERGKRYLARLLWSSRSRTSGALSHFVSKIRRSIKGPQFIQFYQRLHVDEGGVTEDMVVTFFDNATRLWPQSRETCRRSQYSNGRRYVHKQRVREIEMIVVVNQDDLEPLGVRVGNHYRVIIQLHNDTG